MTTVPSLGDDAKREAMRAALFAQGWNQADIDAAFPPPPPPLPGVHAAPGRHRRAVANQP